MGLARQWHGREKMRFRDVGKLHSEERGLVLHFFANHELLALELMALALLKFPDAPQKFRRGVVQTLKDEQEHVRLYRRRMDEIGVEFGQIPVSDYLWKAIAPMRRPSVFVTGLSLTQSRLASTMPSTTQGLRGLVMNRRLRFFDDLQGRNKPCQTRFGLV